MHTFSIITPVYSEEGTNHFRGNKIGRMIEPNKSKCLRGFRVSRPALRAVSSP